MTSAAERWWGGETMFSTAVSVEQSPQTENRRLHPRRKLERLTYVDLGVCNGGIVLDTSEGGIRFQGIQPLDEKQLTCLKFMLPGMRDFIQGRGQIIWVDSTGKGGGLLFTEVRAPGQRLIKQWLDSEQESPASLENSDYQSIETSHSESDPAFEWSVPHLGVPVEMNGHLHDQRPAESLSEGARPSVDSDRVSRASNHNLRAGSSSIWSRKKILTGLSVCGAVVVLGALFFQMRREALRAAPVSAELPSGPLLGLKVERSGQELQIAWNQNADILLRAVGGHLTIIDGSSRKELDLDPSEVRGGKIVYAPATDDVVVRLQLLTGNSEQPVTESVRIMNGRVDPLPRQATTKGPSPHTSTNFVTVHHTASLPAPDTKRSPEESSGSRPTSAVSLPQKSGIAPKIAMPEARSNSAGIVADKNPGASRPILEAGAPDLGFSSLIVTRVPDPPSPAIAPLSEAPSLEIATQQQVKLGGKVDRAQLIAGSNPVYSKRLGQAGVSGNVELHFKISAEGNVRDVSVVKGNPFLAKAAVDAVKTWRYKPTRLNGTAVETQATVVIVFKPN